MEIIAKVTQEGLEKLNDITTKHYQRSTNHRDKVVLKQVLQKFNRIEDLEDSGYARKKRKTVCSVCGEIGHNRHSCVLQDIGNVAITNMYIYIHLSVHVVCGYRLIKLKL